MEKMRMRKNFPIYHSKKCELEGGTARSFKYRKVKNKLTIFFFFNYQYDDIFFVQEGKKQTL